MTPGSGGELELRGKSVVSSAMELKCGLRHLATFGPADSREWFNEFHARLDPRFGKALLPCAGVAVGLKQSKLTMATAETKF